jgi:hypothetical protein
MKNATIGAMVAFVAGGLSACVTDSNRCFPGYEYTAQYDACLQIAVADAGSGDAGGDALAADAAAADGGGEGGAGLGSACNGNGDCPGAASYCLKDPTAGPTDPGICSIPNCTATACGASYACCNCSAAPNADLMAWPAPVCVPSDNETTLVAFGCQCL